MTQLVVWCWFSTTLGTDLTLVWPLSKPEGRGGRWELGLNFLGNFLIGDLGSVFSLLRVHATGRRSRGILAWGNFWKEPNSNLLEIDFQRHNCLAGVLVLVINYTGDRIHFGLATERARREGIKVLKFSPLTFPFLLLCLPFSTLFPIHSCLLFEWLHTFLCNRTGLLNFVSLWSFLSSNLKPKHCLYF